MQNRPASNKRTMASPAEFSAATGVSRTSVWRMMKSGKLAYAHVGRQRRIPLTEFARFGAALVIEAPDPRPPPDQQPGA
jgi:excisionase family DNA binding protein